MEREHHDNELIELGIASVDTKGSMYSMDDEEGGWKLHPGLSND